MNEQAIDHEFYNKRKENFQTSVSKRAAVILLMLISFVLFPSCSHAQFGNEGHGAVLEKFYSNGQLVEVRAKQMVSSKDWNSLIYRFPEFKKATIFMRNGLAIEKKASANINLFANTVELLSEQGDTIRIPSSTQLAYIDFGESSFFYNPSRGFIERVSDRPIELGIKYALAMLVAVGDGTSFRPELFTRSLSGKNRLLVRSDSYYFVDAKNQLYATSLRGLSQLFPAQKNTLRAFVKKK